MTDINRPALLVLIRHAESMRNIMRKGPTYFADDDARQKVRGIPDHKISITEEGLLRALATGLYLRERFGIPDYFYHSGYARTIQTADAILKAYPEEERKIIQVRMNQFIRERDPGHAYDMTEEEVSLYFPYLRDYWKTFGGYLAVPPGGESLAQVVERVYLFLNMLFRDRVGQKVFVCTHGGTLRCFRFLLEHWGFEQALRWPPGQSPKNCGITVYVYDKAKQRLILQEYNTMCAD